MIRIWRSDDPHVEKENRKNKGEDESEVTVQNFVIRKSISMIITFSPVIRDDPFDLKQDFRDPSSPYEIK